MPEWDASQGTNPDTCWHNVIRVDQRGDMPLFVCFSCNSVISDTMREGRKYTFDADHYVWVCKGKPTPEQQSEVRPVDGRSEASDSLPPSGVEIVRHEFPVIIRFADVFLAEDFDIDSNRHRFTEVPFERIGDIIKGSGG